MISRVLMFAFGLFCYFTFFGTILYLIGFVGNRGVPKSIDAGEPSAIGTALVVNLGLFALFGLQHSVMARSGFKRVWTRWVPEPIERSVYVLASSILLLLLYWQWRPLPDLVWNVESATPRTALNAITTFGWVTVFASTFLINHFELFGLRQVWYHLHGQPATPLPFRTPAAYRLVRHPLYFGFLLAFWVTPEMSVGHLLFSLAMTGYLAISIPLEERDLVRVFGDDYRRYQARVPMLLPWPRPRRGSGQNAR